MLYLKLVVNTEEICNLQRENLNLGKDDFVKNFSCIPRN